MRLHAITAVYGEEGLRERLLIDAGRFPAADSARIGAALALMFRVHDRDRRQRDPYACHPLRVSIRILAHYRVTDADVACAALLHDAVEDHARDIAPAGTGRPPSPSWPGSSARGLRAWWRRSPTRSGSRGVTRTSSTASMSSPACRLVPGRG